MIKVSLYTHSAIYSKTLSSCKYRKFRKKLMSKHPICEKCNKELSQEVHHIQPLERFNKTPEILVEKAFDEDNCLCLCRECHKQVHNEMHIRGNNTRRANVRRKQQLTSDFIADFFGDIKTEIKDEDREPINEGPETKQGH